MASYAIGQALVTHLAPPGEKGREWMAGMLEKGADHVASFNARLNDTAKKVFSETLFLNGIAEGFKGVRNYLTGGTKLQQLEEAKADASKTVPLLAREEFNRTKDGILAREGASPLMQRFGYVANAVFALGSFESISNMHFKNADAMRSVAASIRSHTVRDYGRLTVDTLLKTPPDLDRPSGGGAFSAVGKAASNALNGKLGDS